MDKLIEPLPVFCKRVGGVINEHGECEYMDEKTCKEIGGNLELVFGMGERQKHPAIPERYGGKYTFNIHTKVCSVKIGIEQIYTFKTRHKDQSETVSIHPIVGVRHISPSVGPVHGLKEWFEKLPKIIWQSNVGWYGDFDDWNTDRADTGASYTDIQEMDDGSLWICEVNEVSSSVAFGPHTSLFFRYHVKGETAKRLKEKIRNKENIRSLIDNLSFEYKKGNKDVLDIFYYQYVPFFDEEHDNKMKRIHIPASVKVCGSTIFEDAQFDGKHINDFTTHITKKANDIH